MAAHAPGDAHKHEHELVCIDTADQREAVLLTSWIQHTRRHGGTTTAVEARGGGRLGWREVGEVEARDAHTPASSERRWGRRSSHASHAEGEGGALGVAGGPLAADD